jgi:hypothetical protein
MAKSAYQRIKHMVQISKTGCLCSMPPIKAKAMALMLGLSFCALSQAQLVAGIDVGTASYRSNESANGQFLNRESGLISGPRFYFGAQRNWRSKGWLAEFDYKTGSVDYFGLTNLAVPVAANGHVRIFQLSTVLHWPISEFSNNGGIAIAPRLGYRNQARRVEGNPIITSLQEDYQEGIAALGIVVHNEFDRGFGLRARFEIERSLAPRLRAEYPGVYAAAQFNPSPQWRPQLELTGYYRINPRHSVSVTAKLNNYSSGSSGVATLTPLTLGPAIVTNFPGQTVKVNSLNAGYAYHF